MKNLFGISMAVVVGLAFAASAFAADESESARSTFGKWHIGVGAAFNGHVKPHLRARNLPQPVGYYVPYASSKASAWADANNRRYPGGGYIAADDANEFDTENWKLPASSYRGNGLFELDNPYEEVIGSSTAVAHHDNSDDEMQYGISLELSRELWIHDENEEHRWGVDFAAAFSYFFARDIYSAHGTVTRTDEVRDGTIRTIVNDPDATFDYDAGLDSPVNGMYGYGNASRTYMAPALGWSGVGEPYDAGGSSRAVTSSAGYLADGDYQELEMLFMLRPWYEITDWWRVFAQCGLGVSWGRFETSFSAAGIHCDEDFDQWDCYGVAGLGTMFRYKRVDIGFDVFGRFLRDDLDVNGRHVRGSIGRSDWGFRLMLGCSF